MKTGLIVTLLMMLSACVARAPRDVAGEIDAYLSQLEGSQGFSGSVLIAQDGEILLSKGYGMADRSAQIQNTSKTRFRINWLTVPFTAMAVMQLHAAGKLDPQDPICLYIPECPDHWGAITLHHLLTHTSGVSDVVQTWGIEADKPSTGLDRVELIKQQTPYFRPGEQLRYCENGYIILGAVIETVSGQSYEDYLKAHIFDPLAMRDTGYEGEEIAVGHKPSGAEAPAFDISFRYSASGLYSTVEDLYLWDQALYGEQILAQEYLDVMFTGYALTPSVDFPGAHYGYGWFIGNTLDRMAIFHGGAMSGFSSGILRFPDQRTTIIVLRNYEIQIYDRLEIELAKLVFGEKDG